MRRAHIEQAPFRLSVTGIDGAGKDTITRMALEKVSSDLSVVKLGRPAYAFDDGGAQQIYRRTTESFDRMHQLADKRHNPNMIMVANALNVLVQARVLERQARNRSPKPDIVASSRDPRVDPAVYFSYYAPGNIDKRVSIEERLYTMQRLTAAQRDMIVLLKVDPEVAVKRIDARIESEAAQRAASGDTNAGMRDKWRHMHENMVDLAMLAKGYGRALDLLQNIQPTAVVEIDTTDKPKSLVAEIACDGIFQVMNGDILPGERVELGTPPVDFGGGSTAA